MASRVLDLIFLFFLAHPYILNPNNLVRPPLFLLINGFYQIDLILVILNPFQLTFFVRVPNCESCLEGEDELHGDDVPQDLQLRITLLRDMIAQLSRALLIHNILNLLVLELFNAIFIQPSGNLKLLFRLLFFRGETLFLLHVLLTRLQEVFRCFLLGKSGEF